MSGQADFKREISSITQASPAVVTTTEDHDLISDQFVRLTNMGIAGNSNFGMETINNDRFKIKVIDSTSYSLHDPITGEDIDTSNETAYVSNGQSNLIQEDFEYQS